MRSSQAWPGPCLVLLLAAWLGGCASFDPQALDIEASGNEIYSQTRHDITVSTTILSDQQALAQFGANLAELGLQAIWLRIENPTDHAHWLLVSALDANYYPADEAAVLFHSGLNADEEAELTAHFRDLSIPLKSMPGSVNEGYVLAPRHEGGRYVHVLLAGNQHVVDFGFAVPLADGHFDFEQLAPQSIYAGQELRELDLEELRVALRELPCCVRDAAGERDGDPLNLVVVADVGELLAAISRAGWSFTHRISLESVQRMVGAALSGAAYPVAPVSPLYLWDRPQDIALQRARNSIVQRNHLRLWLAPFRFEGRPVWVGQVSRDISIKATTLSPTLTTHVIDPNVDEARENLLQALLVSGSIERFGFVQGMPPAPATQARANLTADPYFTDGLRLVMMISRNTIVSPEHAEFLEWRNSADPIRELP